MEEVSVIGLGVYRSTSMLANRTACCSAAKLTGDSLLIESLQMSLCCLRDAWLQRPFALVPAPKRARTRGFTLGWPRA